MSITRKQLETYCLAKSGTIKEYPFDEYTAVYKVKGKMFALSADNQEIPAVNLKCDPDWSMILRDAYTAVNPGYHMNKKHWNTVTLDNTIPDEEIWEMVDHSYRLVVEKLPKKIQAQLVMGK